MMQGDDDSTATIDLAIAFFCSVLVLFVFVAFNLEDAPEDPVRTTLGQRDATVTIEPPTWSAINERGSFALWHNNQLYILDLTAFARGVVSPTDIYSGKNVGFFSNLPKDGASHAFSLSYSFDLANIPSEWMSDVLSLQTQCPETVRALISVLVPPETDSLQPIIDFSSRCGQYIRIIYTAPITDDGWINTALRLRQSDYLSENIFR